MPTQLHFVNWVVVIDFLCKLFEQDGIEILLLFRNDLSLTSSIGCEQTNNYIDKTM